jgi:hypothetical protein
VFVSKTADAAPGPSWMLVGEDSTETPRVARRVPPKMCSMVLMCLNYSRTLPLRKIHWVPSQ